MIIQEMYFFKPVKNLIKIEDVITEMRKVTENGKKRLPSREINKYLSKIITYLYREFRFDPAESVFTLIYSDSMIFETLFGFYNGIPKDIKEFATIDEKKQIFKFNTKYAPAINIKVSSSMLFNEEFSPKEIVAGILHEIGHSFEWKFRIYFYELENVEKTLNFLDRINFINLGNDKLQKLSIILTKIFNNPNYHTFNGNNENDFKEAESFCDQFATIYGYSKELASFLTSIQYYSAIKIYNKDYKKETFGIFSKLLYNLQDGLVNLLMVKTHPEYGERIRLVIAALQGELNNNKNLTKKQRKILEDKINQINHMVEEALKVNKNDSYPVLSIKEKNKKDFEKEFKQSDVKTRGVDYYLKNK